MRLDVRDLLVMKYGFVLPELVWGINAWSSLAVVRTERVHFSPARRATRRAARSGQASALLGGRDGR